jgi:putative oxidoreductase
MEKFLSRYQAQTYALLRMMAGAMFAFHGLQKTFGFLADHPAAFGTQIWVGGVIELAAGALIALGLKTRWAAFLASGQMAVAYFQFHWRFQMDANFFPTLNHGELAALYCFVFLFFAAAGDGVWSLGSLGGKKKG